MKSIGRVSQDVVRDKDKSIYKIQTDEGEVKVITEGRQAIKDYLFVREGQVVALEGERESNRVYPSESRIVLKNGKEPVKILHE